MEGQGVWFDTEDQARVYVFRHFKQGARSFDVGCFQINYKWHGQAFKSIDDMFDPLLNARYAARFLKRLHDEIGDWTKAAGAYHSRTQKYANRYMARYAEIRDALPEAAQSARPAPGAGTSRVNGFPLLQPQPQGAAFGSLVPLGNATKGSLFDHRSGS